MGILNKNFNIRLARESDVDDIIFIMNKVKQTMKNQDWLYIDDMPRENIIQHISNRGFILVAEDEQGVAAVLIVRYPRKDEDNLGYDIKLKGDELKEVAHVELVVVAPDCRGNGLQLRLMKKAEEILSVMHFKYYMATVHPDNKFCLFNLKLMGYEIQKEKYKYGGSPRYIMLKTH